MYRYPLAGPIVNSGTPMTLKLCDNIHSYMRTLTRIMTILRETTANAFFVSETLDMNIWSPSIMVATSSFMC